MLQEVIEAATATETNSPSIMSSDEPIASVVCTTLNEESSISKLLESLVHQSVPLEELIIVDGGSTDGTLETIQNYIERGVPIKLIVEKGSNIAEGRNAAIRNATNRIVACIDGGSVADSQWLEKILRPFKTDKDVDLVAGFFLPAPESRYEEVVGDLLYPKLERINPDKFLPSARSVAFKKRCWEMVGGYPEWLYTAEDSLFDILLKERGCKCAFASDAIVYWRPRHNLRGLFRQYYLYAKGTREAGIARMGTIEIYGENALSYMIPFMTGYVFSLLRKSDYQKLCYVPVIISTVMLAKVVGIASGRKNHKSAFVKR